MSKIKTKQDISDLKSINGISIEEIQRRSEPLEDKFQDPLWRCRSSSGFLGRGQLFQECLLADWGRVQQLGTTHQILANNLNSILTQVEEIRKTSKWGPNRPILLEYNAENLTQSLGPQKLLVERFSFAGFQHSFFFNPDLEVQDTENWNNEYVITNEDMGITIKVGGEVNRGIIIYIRDYGFYQGGLENGYRIDPAVLVSLLTGSKC